MAGVLCVTCLLSPLGVGLEGHGFLRSLLNETKTPSRGPGQAFTIIGRHDRLPWATAERALLALASLPPGERSLAHFVAFFPAGLHTAYLCAVESFLQHVTRSNANVAKVPVVAVLWVTDRDQFMRAHGGALDAMARRATAVQPRRSVFLLVVGATPDQVVRATPLEQLLGAKDARLGTFARQNIADGMRLAVVWKYSGLYSDLDTIFLVDPTHLGDFIAKQKKEGLNNSPFAFTTARSRFLFEAQDAFVKRFDGETWAHQGPRLFNFVYSGHCRRRERPEWCDRIRVLPQNATQAVPLGMEHRFYLEPGAPAAETIMAHYFNSMLNGREGLRRDLGEGPLCCVNHRRWQRTLIAWLRRAHCPVTYEHLLHFGTDVAAATDPAERQRLLQLCLSRGFAWSGPFNAEKAELPGKMAPS